MIGMMGMIKDSFKTAQVRYQANFLPGGIKFMADFSRASVKKMFFLRNYAIITDGGT